jgi:hypothetical protein
MRLGDRVAKLERHHGNDGTCYRVVVSAADMGLDVPRCIHMLEARGALAQQPGFSLLNLLTKPRDLTLGEWEELGGCPQR